MVRAIVLPILAFAVAAVLWVGQCSGPQPTVVGAPRVEEPEQPGDRYKVEATVQNGGFGQGEVRVVVRLVEKDSGEAYRKDEPLQLERGETARVVVELPAPPGEYEPEVEVEYPPR